MPICSVYINFAEYAAVWAKIKNTGMIGSIMAAFIYIHLQKTRKYDIV